MLQMMEATRSTCGSGPSSRVMWLGGEPVIPHARGSFKRSGVGPLTLVSRPAAAESLAGAELPRRAASLRSYQFFGVGMTAWRRRVTISTAQQAAFQRCCHSLIDPQTPSVRYRPVTKTTVILYGCNRSKLPSCLRRFAHPFSPTLTRVDHMATLTDPVAAGYVGDEPEAPTNPASIIFYIFSGSIQITVIKRQILSPATGRRAKPVAANDVALLGGIIPPLVLLMTSQSMGGVLSSATVGTGSSGVVWSRRMAWHNHPRVRCPQADSTTHR